MGVCLSSNTVRKTIDMMGRDHDVAVKKWVEELSSFIVPYSVSYQLFYYLYKKAFLHPNANSAI